MWRRRRSIRSAPCLVLVLALAAGCTVDGDPEGGSDSGARSSAPTTSQQPGEAIAPSTTVGADGGVHDWNLPEVEATAIGQGMGASVMVDDGSRGEHLVVWRDAEGLCIQLDAAGSSTGPELCGLPAGPTAAAPLAAASVELDGHRYLIGVASHDVVDVALRDGSAMIELRSHMPYPTLRFFARETAASPDDLVVTLGDREWSEEQRSSIEGECRGRGSGAECRCAADTMVATLPAQDIEPGFGVLGGELTVALDACRGPEG